MTALYTASQGAKKKGVSIIADGGISKSGDIVKALTLSEAVICGGLLAGCREAPGRIVEIEGKYYKQYRGMGSLEAMKEGSASRYGHKKEDLSAKSSEFKPEASSEYLARIYIEQNKKEKAIAIYESLSLKFPEKKSYFAGLIKKLKTK